MERTTVTASAMDANTPPLYVIHHWCRHGMAASSIKMKRLWSTVAFIQMWFGLLLLRMAVVYVSV
jgi:hypothetical protein